MTDWNKIKITSELERRYNTINENRTYVIINGYNIPLSGNGIELEWWNSSMSHQELKELIPENTRYYENLETIHQMTGGILEYVFQNHSVNNMIYEEVSDWLLQRGSEPVYEKSSEQIEIRNRLIDSIPKDMTEEKLSLGKFFGLTNQEENEEYNECIDRLMMTEHDDNTYLQKILEIQDLSKLGDPSNRRVLHYVEEKIIKFILVDPAKIGECFDIIYVTDKICKDGMSENGIDLLKYFMNIDQNRETTDDEYKQNMEVVSERLLQYIPDIIKKIIDISEYYEKKECNGEVHKNTLLLKDMYQNILKNNSAYSFPDLGIQKFFEGFQENIVTKVILLIFIAFLISQILGLFKINYNINK
uniref:Uncharacterized protein n=1 Tax=viral metagenome TaxID=1070528 RepID=A0A6C0L133_9ZZZZ|tara:strand:+ start:7226 stop:8305 length:1080 start_codon:yes stop_codon:yes gene_type:complete